MNVVAFGPKSEVSIRRQNKRMEFTEIEEELGKDVESEQSVAGELVEGKSNSDEEDGEHGEAHELNRLAANEIDSGNGDPVSWNGTSADKNQITDGAVVECLVDGGSVGIANGSQNDTVVETESVFYGLVLPMKMVRRRLTESNVEEEPRACRSEQDLAILPLAIVTDEVVEAGLGDLESLVLGQVLGVDDLIGYALGLS